MHFWEKKENESGLALRCDSGHALRCESGQALITSMLFMSGLMLSATVISGLLVVYQIRQAIDAASSAQAIFAADAGVEETLRCFYYDLQVGIQTASACDKTGTLPGSGAYATKLFFKRSGGTFVRDNWESDVVGFRVISEGTSGRTVRILEENFNIR